MTPEYGADPTAVLDPLPVDDSVKADVWDAFHSAAGPSHFKSLMDPLGIPDEAKADLWDMKFGGGGEPADHSDEIEDSPEAIQTLDSEPLKPTQVQRVSPQTPNPPTAATATEPEHPSTIALQLGQLSGGLRRVVMFPKAQGQPPNLPTGLAVTHDDFGNTYAYRPDLIRRADIHSAARNNTLTSILGGPGGMGAPDKSALQGEVMAVSGHAPDGTEAQSTATDAANLHSTVAATRTVTPPGGRIRISPIEKIIAQRAAAGQFSQARRLGKRAVRAGTLQSGQMKSIIDTSARPGQDFSSPADIQ